MEKEQVKFTEPATLNEVLDPQSEQAHISSYIHMLVTTNIMNRHDL